MSMEDVDPSGHNRYCVEDWSRYLGDGPRGMGPNDDGCVCAMAPLDLGGLVILVPILSRAHRVAPLVANIEATTPDARILFCCTPGDDEVIREVERWVGTYLLVPRSPDGRHDYPRKINAGYRATTEPWIFTGADDIVFDPGWLDAARVISAQDDYGVIGTNDGGNPRVLAGVHSTHSLVARWYADGGCSPDRSFQIYHEGYWHEGCDDELVAVARARGAYAHAHEALVTHLHPDWGTMPTDGLYERDRGARMRAGRRLFAARRKLWGG
jgi:hypothetical protein